MKNCTYTAQGFMFCPKPSKEALSFFEGFVNKGGKCQPPSTKTVFEDWDPANFQDQGHIFKACEKSSCRLSGCSCGGSKKSCQITCNKCQYCDSARNVMKNASVSSGSVQVTGAGAVKKMYWCPSSNRRLQLEPCSKEAVAKLTCPTSKTTQETKAKFYN